MKVVGVRELRQRASELLRLVELGEAIEVTDRGRAIAMLGPIKGRSELSRLRDAGETSGASRGIDGLPAPLEVKRRMRPSRVLARLRANER